MGVFEDSVNAAMDAKNGVILDMLMKCQSVFESHNKAFVSVSGGGDSDVLIDLCERVRTATPIELHFGFFYTGLEYQATLSHLDYLEDRYGIEIVRYRPEKSIPTCARVHGEPFLSKYVSQNISRLQKYGFQWEDEPFDILRERYPNCKSALRWWTNTWTRTDRPGWFDIGRNQLLKEFMVENPPDFPISDKCCHYTKKKLAKQVNRQLNVDVDLVGVREAEGGIRAATKSFRKSCITINEKGVDHYRPLYWLDDVAKADYVRLFDIHHSDCYEVWGFTRTGCVGCPFGKEVLSELEVARVYEPRMVSAVERVFAHSYEYTRRYYEYRLLHRKGRGGQMRLNLRHARD